MSEEENKLVVLRRQKLTNIRAQRNAFPNHFRREDLAHELQEHYGKLSRDALAEQRRFVKVAGRIMAKRGPFLILQDMSGRLQVYVNRKKTRARSRG